MVGSHSLSYLDQNMISYHGLGKFLGRLTISQTLIFGKFARTKMRPFYQKQYRRVYNAALSAEERSVFSRRCEIITSFTPSICRPLSRKFDWPLYTDAATNPPCSCALLFNPWKASISLDSQLAAFVRPWTHLFKLTCLIFGLDLLALAAFVEDFGPWLAGKSIWIYMGNNICLSAMTRGESNTEAIAILVGRIWGALQRYRASAWFSRVPPKQNPPDLPTRGETPPFHGF